MKLHFPCLFLLPILLAVQPLRAQARPKGKTAAQAQRAPKPRQDSSAAAPVMEGKRVALVIGNGAYRESSLKNPPNDARAVTRALQDCGFQVETLVDATLPQMEAALRQFGQRLRAGGVGLFYYAGHGMQVKGVNYLIPVGANIAEEDEIRFKALDANQVLAKMESAGNGFNMLILDACRNDPFGRAWRRGGPEGLAQMDAPTGTYIAFATAPGRTASDGSGQNGLYTQHLLKTLKQPGLSVEQVFKRVRVGVKQDSRDQQVPWDSSSLTGDFYFVPGATAPTSSPAQPAHPQESSDGMDLNAQGRPESTVDLGSGQRMILVQVPAGRFTMKWDVLFEEPHEITISRDFWMGKYEVTQAQWQAVMGSNPSTHSRAGSDAPVETVSWNECQDFLRRLNGMQSQFSFRLPTEAEWEYACRAGGPEEPLGSLDSVAWYLDSTALPLTTTYPVGQKQPNAWGLHDMLGNVCEWCQDWDKRRDFGELPRTDPQGPSFGTKRILRGGSIASHRLDCRPTRRYSLEPDGKSGLYGFRVLARAR